MYFCDAQGLVWLKDGDCFRNVGLTVKEKTVTFQEIKVTPSPVTMEALTGAVPITLREAIRKLNVTAAQPLEPLKGIINLEV